MSSLGFVGFFKALTRLLTARPVVPKSLAGNTMLQTVLQRRSVRSFKDESIPDAVREAILEAGRLAPSTVNLQSWSFGVFDRQQWRDFFGQPAPFAAPLIVVVLADINRVKRAVPGFPYAPLCEYTVAVMNASLAAMNMNVAAEALGVASVMMSETGRTGFYDARFLARKLELPAGVFPIMSIAFGYPSGGRPAMPPKLPQAAVTFDGPYREAPPEVLTDWFEQMQAGYQVSNFGKRFVNQIKYYNSRIEEAESDLHKLVFHK